MKVILVELADKGSKVGVFEHPREDGLCEFIHILSREISSNHLSARGAKTIGP